jgi:type I restriction enzyme M protein
VDIIKQGRFDISVMAEAIKKLSQSTIGKSSQEDFDGLFEDMDLNSNKLGKGEKDRSDKLGKIILKVSDIDFSHGDAQIDVLGDAYEYLIGQFAANAGKKAGEFYTPQAVSEILALAERARAKIASGESDGGTVNMMPDIGMYTA